MKSWGKVLHIHKVIIKKALLPACQPSLSSWLHTEQSLRQNRKENVLAEGGPKEPVPNP